MSASRKPRHQPPRPGEPPAAAPRRAAPAEDTPQQQGQHRVQPHDVDAEPPAQAPPQPGTVFAGVVLGFVCLALGGLAYHMVVTMLQPPAVLKLPEVAAPDPAISGGEGRLPASWPADPGRGKSTSQRPLDRQAGAVLALQCLSGGQAEQQATADPSNFGPRQASDWQGRPVAHRPALIVLHETVVDEATTLALFRSLRSNDAQQASYHVLIGRDGRRIRVVPDSARAYGAGDSDFQGMAVQLKPGLRPSLNNIALHGSLVSPPDGADGERRSHSGYSAEQYRSLASQIAQWQALHGIPASAVLTHQEVDRSGTRRDPRSFDWSRLSRELRHLWVACGGTAATAELGRGR